MRHVVVATTLLLSSLAQATPTEPKPYQDCGLNEQAKQLARLIITDPQQQRAAIRCNTLLSKVAADKAREMASNGLVVHNLGGSPNQRLRDAGYALPVYYSNVMSNQVEAIAGGYSSAEDVWYAFKHSHSHRQHLLGEHPFYQEQDELGVAFLKDKSTPHVEYWVVYLTKGNNQAPAQKFDEIPNKGIDMMTDK